MAQQQRSGGPLRSALSALCGLVSMLLVPIGIIAVWAAFTLTDTNAFVEDLRPVAAQPEVQQAVTDGIVDGVLQTLDLRPAVEDLVAEPLKARVSSAVASPEFEALWARAIGVTHAQFIAAMKGEDGATIDKQGRLLLTLTVPIPTITAILEKVGVALPAAFEPSVTIPLLSAQDLAQARSVYRVVDAAGWWTPIAALVLAILCIAFARDGRRATIRLAAGWAVMAALLALAIVVLREPVVAAAGDQTAVTVVDAAYGVATLQLFRGIGAVLAFVLLTMVAASIARGRKELS